MVTSSEVSKRNGKTAYRPGSCTELNGRWYGRGIADNKGQHSVNMSATSIR